MHTGLKRRGDSCCWLTCMTPALGEPPPHACYCARDGFRPANGSTRHTEGFSIHDFMHSLPGPAGFRFWSELTSIPSGTFRQPRRLLFNRNAEAQDGVNLDVVQRIFSVFVICWLRQLKRYHVLRYTANAGGRPTSGSQLASTPLRELPAHTKRPPVDRGPCFALALLRYSFQVGFEPSLLQRQFIARGLAAAARTRTAAVSASGVLSR